MTFKTVQCAFCQCASCKVTNSSRRLLDQVHEIFITHRGIIVYVKRRRNL